MALASAPLKNLDRSAPAVAKSKHTAGVWVEVEFQPFIMSDKSSDGQERQISIQILSLRKIWIEDEGCEGTSSFLHTSYSVDIFAKTGASSFTKIFSSFV